MASADTLDRRSGVRLDTRIRLMGVVLAGLAGVNTFVTIALPPRGAVTGFSRFALTAISAALFIAGVALAARHRWAWWPTLVAVTAAIGVSLGLLASDRDLSIHFTSLPGDVTLNYPTATIILTSLYALGLGMLLGITGEAHGPRSERAWLAYAPALGGALLLGIAGGLFG